MFINTLKGYKIEKFDHRTNIANNVSIQEFSKNSMLSRLDVDKMSWIDGVWKMNKIKHRKFDKNNSFYLIEDSSFTINIDPIDLTEVNVKPQEMNYWALKSFIYRLENNGRDYKKWLVDLHFKTAFSFSSLFNAAFKVDIAWGYNLFFN